MSNHDYSCIVFSCMLSCLVCVLFLVDVVFFMFFQAFILFLICLSFHSCLPFSCCFRLVDIAQEELHKVYKCASMFACYFWVFFEVQFNICTVQDTLFGYLVRQSIYLFDPFLGPSDGQLVKQSIALCLEGQDLLPN